MWMALAVCCTVLTAAFSAFADEPQFSGPQVGEKMTPFQAQAVFGKEPSKNVNALGDVDGPLLLIFVHQVNRPSVGFSRMLMDYAVSQKQAGLAARLVFLTNDPPDMEAWFRRARHALPKNVSPLISADGADGPGAYGLNRDMTVTVLVADKNKVTANFALVQPSIQVDAPKVGQAIANVLGLKDAPTLKDMGFEGRRMAMGKGKRAMTAEQEGIYRKMMSPVIQKTATADQVATAAKEVEQFAAKNPWFKNRVHNAANLIVNSGKLANYGTADAQGYLTKWAKEFAPKAKTDAAKP